MAKSQTSQATNASANLLNQAQGLTSPIVGGLQQAGATASTNQANELSSASGGIAQAQSTGGYNPGILNTLQGETANLASTGGYTPTQTNSLNSGGYDPNTLSTTNTGYTNLATTGGYTPTQEQAFVRQATEGTTDTYNTLMNQSKLATNKTGGLGTGGTYSQLARQLGQAQSADTLNAEVALNQSETQNKLAGLGGLSSSQNAVAANTLQGQESLASGIQQGTNQQLGLNANVASGTTSANSQMSQLYNTTTGQLTAIGQQVLSALGLDFSTQDSTINSLTALSKNPGALQTILGDVAGLGGAAAGAAGALGVKA